MIRGRVAILICTSSLTIVIGPTRQIKRTKSAKIMQRCLPEGHTAGSPVWCKHYVGQVMADPTSSSPDGPSQRETALCHPKHHPRPARHRPRLAMLAHQRYPVARLAREAAHEKREAAACVNSGMGLGRAAERRDNRVASFLGVVLIIGGASCNRETPAS